MKNIPEKISIGITDAGKDQGTDDFSQLHLEDVCWCPDRIDEKDPVYVLLDNPVETLNEEDKYNLGVEIIAGMKASAYNESIEWGREDAVAETELTGGEVNGAHIEFVKRNKVRLKEQALFIAGVALKKLKGLNNEG